MPHRRPAVGARVKNDSKIENLEEHLDGKDASEDIVKVGQNKIPGEDSRLTSVIKESFQIVHITNHFFPRLGLQLQGQKS